MSEAIKATDCQTDLTDLTLVKCRDLIVKCFFVTHKEVFAKATQMLQAQTTDDSTIYANVVGSVRMSFREIGENYDRPTRAGLTRVLEVLARKARCWGTSSELIEQDRVRFVSLINLAYE